MKRLICVLGLLLVQSAFALPNATERLNSLLPFGTYDGDDCRVKVSRTIRGNTKVTVTNLYRRINIVIPKNQYYRYIPGSYYAVSLENRSGSNLEKNYLFVSQKEDGDVSVLVGKSRSSREGYYHASVDCTPY